MKIDVTASVPNLDSAFRESVVRRLGFMLDRFSHRVSDVSVVVTDENGPRGGIDKRCRITVLMPGVGRVTTTARGERAMVAVAQAARRARRIVVNKMKRPKMLRGKSRKPSYSFDTVIEA